MKEEFAGAMVYHTGGNGIPAGIYVWNKTNWTPLTENCTAPVLTLTEPPFIKKGTNAVFSVSSDASARCAEGETYEWFKADTPDGVADTPFGSGASASTAFAAAGNYRVKVEATSPYSPVTIKEEKDISVTENGGPDLSKLRTDYGIVGETCLDVKRTGQGTEVYTDRKDGFEGNIYAKTYKFHHDNSYSDLKLFLDDPDHLVDGITPPAEANTGAGEEPITVTFKSNVRDLVPASGNSLTVALYATYKPHDDTDTKYAYLKIRVEDGTCVCPAKTGANTSLNFMCHNLGGLDIISPSQLITYEHHGNWYRFGAKEPSLVNNGINNGSQGWSNDIGANPTYYGLTTGYVKNNNSWDWPDALANYEDVIGNPCPAGWRLPTYSEWLNVINNNNYTNVPAATWAIGETVFSNLKKLGDYLMLPAAGWRSGSNTGVLLDRGSKGYYWSSTTYDGYDGNGRNLFINSGSIVITNVTHTSRSFGMSVRCVQAANVIHCRQRMRYTAGSECDTPQAANATHLRIPLADLLI